MLDFLRARATPGVETVAGDAYRRTIEVNGVAGTIEVRAPARAPHLLVHVDLPGGAGRLAVATRVRRAFDLDADPREIGRVLGRDPDLRAAVRAAPGLRVPGAWDAFELAVRAVLGQQITVRAATTLAGRLAHEFGRPVARDDGLVRLFPRPERLAEADVARIGLPRVRAATLRALAAAVARRDLVLEPAHDPDATLARLRAIPGIGRWTAAYVAMRALGQPDAFPSGDLGLRRARGNGAGRVAAADIERQAETWRPWRAYAAMYLWRGAP
jgi:AraC family transcriptional regulator of adaptative response / DNA-3-methyladenine glycosylase II